MALRTGPIRGGGGRRGPWALISVATVAVFGFVVGIGVAAFITRYNQGPVDVAVQVVSPLDAGRVIAEPRSTLTDHTVLEALGPLLPGLARCFGESRARDPAAGDRATLEVSVSLGAVTSLVAVECQASPSPFFRPCLREEAGPVVTPGDVAAKRIVTALYEDGDVRIETSVLTR